ncbi:ABC transporter permease [Pendulispora albinea]|uniref:ABC transporter permease n=1 Tax=Pendulispora albinea TaxID=2741071 RepID=A0ABZ2M1M5_9BACT
MKPALVKPAFVKPALLRAAALVVSLVFVGAVCLLMGASPAAVAVAFWDGAFGTVDQAARVLGTLSPLLLCASGLLFTFRAGLYNLGVEGQLVVGAIAATGAASATESVLPAWAVIAVALVAGMLAGASWGVLTGVLHVFGRVSEIFAGLGMNFMAQGAALYLIFGPWKREGVASMAGTEPMDRSLWMSTFGTTDASPTALLLAIAAAVFTAVLIQRTHFGLKVRAVGQNLRSAHVLGVPAVQQLLIVFAACGVFSGLAGALQVMAVFHRLIPNVSSNLGYLALLVVMLASFDMRLVVPIAVLFSVLNVGSLRLPLALGLESSLSGVLQGALALVFLLLPRGDSGARREGT